MRRFFPIAAACIAIEAGSAHALQVIEARDGVTVQASVSLKEPTRIKVEGAAITDVFGNVYSSNCAQSAPASGGAPQPAPAVNPAGEIALECDRDKGEIFIKPIGQGAKPINLFVSTSLATYTLLLSRVDMPADTIVIKDRSASAKRAGPDADRFPARSGSHVRALKAMLVALASDQAPSDMRVEEVGRPLQLWKEARLTLMRVLEGRGMIGEVYILTNVSSQPMVLAEEEFDRDGDRVLGVAIEHHNLRPGDSTNVYVLRAGN